MAYQGIAFAILVGVAIGTALYCYFSQENNQQQQQREYQYEDREYTTDSTYDQWSTSSSGYIASGSSRRRRRDSNTKCSICLTELINGSVKTLESCGHEFHVRCISTWLRREKTCPNCRHPVYL